MSEALKVIAKIIGAEGTRIKDGEVFHLSEIVINNSEDGIECTYNLCPSCTVEKELEKLAAGNEGIELVKIGKDMKFPEGMPEGLKDMLSKMFEATKEDKKDESDPTATRH